jgi:hypothetical protein
MKGENHKMKLKEETIENLEELARTLESFRECIKEYAVEWLIEKCKLEEEVK